MDPFARQARQYLLSRPTYPTEFLLKIKSRVGKNSTSKTCLDVACGSGQLTTQLAEFFQEVVGVDRSLPQLKEAMKHDRVRYEPIEDATNLTSFKTNEWDCVTLAQALHWLPLEHALSEFHRVLKPNGIFAVMGYGICHLQSAPSESHILTRACVRILKTKTNDRCYILL